MHRFSRIALSAAVIVLSMSVPLRAADVRVTSEAGIITPILLVPSSAFDFSIKVESLNQFAGDVTFTAKCCLDYFTRASVTPPAVFVTPPQDILQVPANGSISRVLEIRAGSTASTGKYSAVVEVKNAAAGIDHTLWINFAVNAGADFTIQNRPPAAAAIFPDLTPPPKSATYQLFITSTNRFSGPITLTASCCWDVMMQTMVTMPEVSFSFSSPSVEMSGQGTPPGGLETLFPTVAVSTAGPPLFGKFLLAVNGMSRTPPMTRTTNLEFSEFAVPNPPVLCRPGVEVLDIGPFVANVANIREQNATKPIVFAMANLARLDGWEWTMEEDPTLTRNEATIVLKNSTGSTKAITTSRCSRRAQTLTVQGGISSSMRIMTPTDSTIVFSKEVCASRFLWWCTSTTMMDVAVLSEPAFWRLLGGRKNTFVWIDR